MAIKKDKEISPKVLSDTPLAYHLNELSKKYYGAVSKHFEQLDMERNYFVLNFISKHKNIKQQSLANLLNMDKTRMVHVIDYLSGKGLVKREQSTEDRREQNIVITKKADKYIEKISAGFSALNKTAFKGFTKTEQQHFFDMIDKIDKNIAALPSENYSLKFVKSKK
jgi:MarR family transcriptional regulator, transcriptional regulator for hemolysin